MVSCFFARSWIIPNATPEVCLEHVISAVAKLSETEKMHINKVGNYIMLRLSKG